jgi:hypothetical protein
LDVIVGLNRSFPGPWRCNLTKSGVLIRDHNGVALAHVRAFGPRARAKCKGRVLSPAEAKAVAYAISKAPLLWYWLRMYRSGKHRHKRR